MFNCLPAFLLIVISVHFSSVKLVDSHKDEKFSLFKLIDPFGDYEKVNLETKDEVKPVDKSDKANPKCLPTLTVGGGYDYTGIESGSGGSGFGGGGGDFGGLPPGEIARRRQIAARRAVLRRIAARRRAIARRRAWINRNRKRPQGNRPIGSPGVGPGIGGDGPDLGPGGGGGSGGGDDSEIGNGGGIDNNYDSGSDGDTQYDQGGGGIDEGTGQDNGDGQDYQGKSGV